MIGEFKQFIFFQNEMFVQAYDRYSHSKRKKYENKENMISVG